MRMTVIGGGIIGLSCALALLDDGCEVTVLDADQDRSAASWGNAGHIATEQVVPLASWASIRTAHRRRFARGGALDLPIGQWRHWLPFARRFVQASRATSLARGTLALTALQAGALPAWRDLVATTGCPALLRCDGHYVVWESERTATAGAAAWRTADTGTAIAHPASAAERARLARLAPGITGDAIRFGGSAQIADLGGLAAALEAAIATRGGTIVRTVARLTISQARAVVPGHASDLVLVAAGARSADLLAATGTRVPLVAERGYYIRADAGDWPVDMPPIVFEDRSMIVTRYADSVQAASFVEFGSVDAPPDPRKWERLETHVRALGLPMRPPFTRWMGARPTLPDYLPAIGRSARVENLLYAFGHQHLGLTLAPVTARLVAALARGDRPQVDIAAYAVERFG